MRREKLIERKEKAESKIREKSKKIIILIFTFFISLLSFGCRQQEELVWEPGVPFPREKLTIGIIHPNEIESASIFDYAHYVGTLEMQQRAGLGDHQIIRKTNVFDRDPAAVEGAMRDSIAEGANVIIAASWGYMDVCERLAEEFPNVIFLHSMGYKFNDRNFTNYAIRLYHARYLAGIVAGLATQTNMIGFVAAWGKDNSQVTSGINAFAIGVESVNPDARVYVRITHSWFDPMGETNAANALIAAGCDVITTHVNTSSAQIAAQRAGVLAIGYNYDMSADAPDAVITSVVPYWGPLYTRLIEDIIDGTFNPQPHFYGLAEGVINITPLNSALAPQGVETVLHMARQRILNEGFNVFDDLSDDVILSSMDWYNHNVMEF